MSNSNIPTVLRIACDAGDAIVEVWLVDGKEIIGSQRTLNGSIPNFVTKELSEAIEWFSCKSDIKIEKRPFPIPPG